MPTSVGTVATSVPDPVPRVMQDQTENDGLETIASGAAPEAMLQAVEVDIDKAQHSGDEDEDESYVNDNLQLQSNEYIVPLPFHGRQADAYRDFCKRLIKKFESRAQNPTGIACNVETALYELRAVETHVGLIRDDNTTTQPTDGQHEKDEHLAQWSYDLSIKFQFLKALLSRMRDRDLHVVLLIEEKNNIRFLNIVESFLRRARFSFNSPMTGRSHIASEGTEKGKNLLTTILSITSDIVLREAHLIVCLDGKPDATQIRERSWGMKPGFTEVPLLRLVIPRTVGHLDYHLSPKISRKRRLRIIVATLSKWISEHRIGHMENFSTSESYEIESAHQVLQYLLPMEDEPSLRRWPLTTLENIKHHQSSQQPQETNRSESPFHSPVGAAKRRLPQGQDPAKRTCYTLPRSTQINNSHVGETISGAPCSSEHDYVKDYRTLTGCWEHKPGSSKKHSIVILSDDDEEKSN